MLQGWFILLISFVYLSLLFAVAYYGDRRADQGRSLIANPYIYTLSMAVYCTSWTYYGSVGRAASDGLNFLAIYTGPTLTFVLWRFVIRKIIRISKVHRITSIADFIASRYGKSALLGGLVAVIAVVGIMPYISLQLKAISTTLDILSQYPRIETASGQGSTLGDTTLFVALALGIFTILFGTRHIDAGEHHEGMVAAIAFESLVKLVAFLAVGLFVTYGIYSGFEDLFARAAAHPRLLRLYQVGTEGSYSSWITLTILSMAAIICLPRQFQVTVVENVNEAHLNKAVWLFPLYLLVINVFVLPIALSGLLHFPSGEVSADTFVLTIPMAEHQEALALFAYLGGFSAATGMLIVALIALSTMVCNDLAMPVLLRIRRLGLAERGDLTGVLLDIRRGSILVILFLGYVNFKLIGESYALVTIGLMSFCAAAQFAPAIIGGIFWKNGTYRGALTGLSLGFLIWGYTLMLPAIARSGWLPGELVEHGPFGIAWLKPYELFGLQGLDPLSHALFWSMLANIGGYFGVSLWTRQSAVERIQAVLFVDVFRHPEKTGGSRYLSVTAKVTDLHDLLMRFVGRYRADQVLGGHAHGRHTGVGKLAEAGADLVSLTERELAGVIGAASARVMLGSVVHAEAVRIEEVMEILDEASQVIETSRRLERKSRQLEAATAELRAANERLQELDHLKDDFVSTVSHELRTPLTSIRSFSEILYDHPELEVGKRNEFLDIIVKESERLTRLIDQILDFAKMESGSIDWRMADIDAESAIEQALQATRSLFEGSAIELEVEVPASLPVVYADFDRLIQVVVNLLSNAVKYCSPSGGRVTVAARNRADELLISVSDNGPGVPLADQERIFERFQQAGQTLADKPYGTGLGLAICREIIEHFGGRIWLESRPGRGATFAFTVPHFPARSQPARRRAP